MKKTFIFIILFILTIGTFIVFQIIKPKNSFPVLDLDISNNTLNGTISDIDNSSVSSFGFVWGEKGSIPTVDTHLGMTSVKQNINTNNYIFTHTLTEGIHTVRAYATHNEGTTYSTEKVFMAFINIPDNTFRNAIINCINNGNTRESNTQAYQCTESYQGEAIVSGSSIRQDVLESITVFSYSNLVDALNTSIQINDITGLKYMTKLSDLDLDANNISNFDVSFNTALTGLSAEDNSLTSIDISHNTRLTAVELAFNSLTSIDLKNNKSLTLLDISVNSLRDLNLSTNTSLVELIVSQNSFLTCIQIARGQNISDNDLDNTQRFSTNCN